LSRERGAVSAAEHKLRAREESLRDREDKLRRRLDAKVDDQLREAAREIDAVVEGLKTRAAELSAAGGGAAALGRQAAPGGISTGDTGAVRADARAALDAVVERLKHTTETPGPATPPVPDAPIEEGSRVTVGTLGLEGTVIEVHGKHAEVDVRGKRLRAALRDLKVVAGSARATRPTDLGRDLRRARRATSTSTSICNHVRACCLSST
jgi:hypothetical protein